jgi:hypothetical protein
VSQRVRRQENSQVVLVSKRLGRQKNSIAESKSKETGQENEDSLGKSER